MDKELETIIDAQAPYLRVIEGGKVECTLNGHTFPPTIDAIQSFVKCVIAVTSLYFFPLPLTHTEYHLFIDLQRKKVPENEG